MSNNLSPAARPEWAALQAHCGAMQGASISSLMDADKNRFENFSLEADGVFLDYSRHRVTAETMGLLMKLAQASGIEQWRDRMFAGEKINTTENRAVLHTALRGSAASGVQADGENIPSFVAALQKQIEEVSERIRADKAITDVVSIGIGGSHLGPRMVCRALSAFADGPRVHFVSNVDGADILSALKNLKPENTLFIVASKTFSTRETVLNSQTAKEWSGGRSTFVAITADAQAARAFGIKDENILPMREWIGGRYSLWSGIGLPIAILLGYRNFKSLLDGARAMDTHFKTAPLAANMPIVMAVLGIWYRNFHDCHAHAILPYAQNLRHLPRFIQQLDMESNGKSVDRDGHAVKYGTSPVIFGEAGTNCQHAFLQHLHQGTDITPADFIGIINPGHKLAEHHRVLLVNMLAQARALSEGQNAPDAPHTHFAGNKPNSTLLLNSLDPYHLGLLLALYEHKIFVQGVIWNINSFDQYGVELGKTIARSLEKPEIPAGADSSTRGLLHYIQKKS